MKAKFLFFFSGFLRSIFSKVIGIGVKIRLGLWVFCFVKFYKFEFELYERLVFFKVIFIVIEIIILYLGIRNIFF